MSSNDIPDDIRRYILMNIPSVPFLEALLLLRGDTQHDWDSNRVARQLYMGDKAAALLLVELQAARLAEITQQEPAQYRYAPQTDELRQIITRLAEVYARNLVNVTHLIHSTSGKKAQRFADAFVWRKDS